MQGVVFVVIIAALAIGLAECDPMWKVFCTQDPLFRGRADPIVAPGATSGHSHKVWGASKFGVGSTSQSNVDLFNSLQTSKCNTCSITKDMSNYWSPDLYYKWANGSLSLVPTGGLTVYYLSRRGPADTTKPKFRAFPPGFRMIAGNPFLRSYNATYDAGFRQTAITWNCIGGNSTEQGAFPTDKHFCSGGLRAQVFFPMCWDGVNLDSPDHVSHVAYPIQGYNSGDCPAAFPVKIPGVFFEILYSVSSFPHGTGTNPFLLACGDTTGYGLHGDFLNGWDEQLVARALVDPSCDLDTSINLKNSYGNNVSACDTLRPYLVNEKYCPLETPIANTEDIGINHVLSQLAGCNPITSGPSKAIPCSTASPTANVVPSYVKRVTLQSASNSLFLVSWTSSFPLAANTTAAQLSRGNVFNFFAIAGGYAIVPEGVGSSQYVTADLYGGSKLIANRGSPSGWETFTINFVSSTTLTIFAQANSMYASLQADGSIAATATTVTVKETFNYKVVV